MDPGPDKCHKLDAWSAGQRPGELKSTGQCGVFEQALRGDTKFDDHDDKFDRRT